MRTGPNAYLSPTDILRSKGYLIVGIAPDLEELPCNVTCDVPSSIVPLGATVRVIERVSLADAQAFAFEFGYRFEPGAAHYKVVAE
jgi:hypothetical protein